jgi:hypothetical protein
LANFADFLEEMIIVFMESAARPLSVLAKAKSVMYSLSKLSIVSKVFELKKGVVTGEAPHLSTLRDVSESEFQQGRNMIPSKLP